MEIFRRNFFASSYSALEGIMLSSGAMVTAAHAVQKTIWRRLKIIFLIVIRAIDPLRGTCYCACATGPSIVEQEVSMLQPKSTHSQKSIWIGTLALLAFLSTGCGSSSKNENLSQAQAQAISQQVTSTLQSALNAALTSSGYSAPRENPPSLSVILHDAQPQQASDCTTTNGVTNCNVPISFSGPCPGGGTISVAGTFELTLNSAGAGSDTAAITVTPSNCSVDNLTINGAPSIALSLNDTIANDSPFPLSLTESGGISYGPNPSGTCTLNVMLSASSVSSCTVTGTVCGQSVNGSC